MSHPSGLPSGDATLGCAGCAWCSLEDARPGMFRCLAAAVPGESGVELPLGTAACAHWELPADCDSCGACCREAFDAVPVNTDAEHARLHAEWPDFVEVEGDWRQLQRVPSPQGRGSRCAALVGDGGEDSPWRCVVYSIRPQTCRDLAANSDGCLIARRRVGLTPWRPGDTPDGPLHRDD